ncbi:MAG: hypothetical protein NZP74_13785 [Anaerolineales bacterium]|nr:hypothetical protein [Anaerolineales bacterium]MDW8279434.1 hypothetical protein [Anaerolineales bacterium]
MNHIHVKPDVLYETACQVWQQRLLMEEELQALRASLRRLETAWHSPGAAEFFSDGRAWIDSAEQQLEHLDMLGMLLHQQATRWQQSDERWGEFFRALQVQNSRREK